jgi:NADH-quinone oxidoreductase subunit N
VIDTPSIDWLALAPVLAPLAGATLALLLSVVLPYGMRRAVAAFFAAVGLLVGFVLAAYVYWKSPEAHGIVADAARRDRLATLAQMMIAGAGVLTVGIAWRDQPRQEHVGEYFALLSTAAAGMMFMVSASNLMTLFLGLEWFSISLYVLCAIDIELETSLESGLKYLIVGSFGSAILLFGFALVYGATGALELGAIGEAGRALEHDSLLLVGLAMVLTGLGFKASAAPFHMWTPDVYQGSPTPVTAFMSAATKVTALVVMLRVLNTAFPAQEDLWSGAVAAIAVASLAIGNLAALVQRNVKRMLAYSSVSHAGFMLIPIAAANELGAKALMYYLVPYAAMSLGAFGVVAARERELGMPVTIENLAGFGWERPLFGAAMAIFMAGFLGFPLTGGFIGKFYAFAAAWDSGYWWLIVAGVIATMISAYYYLGVVRAMYFRERLELRLAPVGGSPPRDIFLSLSVAISLGIVLASFVLVEPLINLAEKAAASLPL